jgi:beta-glucosidase
MRVGTNGRDYEYMSGEDPYLASELVGPLVKGIQSNNVMAAMKNFINDERETDK